MNRREIIKASVLGTAGLSFFSRSLRASANQQPKFFIVANLDGGLDPSYMFDGRPRSFTQHGHITNYFPEGREHYLWQGASNQTLASDATRPLLPWKDHFSVLKGVHMSQGFDGHLENFRVLLTGHPFGGDFFGSTAPSDASLDFVYNDVFLSGVDNRSAGLQLNPEMLRSLAKISAQKSGANRNTPGRSTVLARLDYWSEQEGAFSKGARQFRDSLASSGNIRNKIAKVELPEQAPPAQQRNRLITEVFSNGLSDRCLINLTPGILDVHDRTSCSQMPQQADLIASAIADLFSHLHQTECPLAPGKSFLEVTTIIIASEFGRTLRQDGLPISRSGTDHNPLNNQILIAGPQFKSGEVFGESDLDKLDRENQLEAPSSLHQSLDPKLLRAMGKAIDHETGNTLPMPESYLPEKFLTMRTIINTIFDSWDVPSTQWLKADTSNDSDIAPSLRALFR